MQCSSCSLAMIAETFDGHYGRQVKIDLCYGCAAIWFDANESLALTPGAVLQLFLRIHEHRGEKRGGALAHLHCPYCHATLRETQDSQRNVRFSYWSCPSRHGRLTRFADFLREKHFVRPLGPQELEQLRENLQVIHCDACGAAVDVQQSSACGHCGAALSLLDSGQVEKMIATLRTAEEQRQHLDPELPQKLLLERLQLERHYSDLQQSENTGSSYRPSHDLVEAGLAAVAALLNKRP